MCLQKFCFQIGTNFLKKKRGDLKLEFKAYNHFEISSLCNI